MDAEMKKQDIDVASNMETMKVCIDMASLEEKRINKVCREFYEYGKTFIDNLQREVVLPKKIESITTLRNPSGQGTKKWSRYKMIVHLRNFYLEATHQQLEKVVQFLRNFPHVEINLSIQN
ncbi:ribosomal protein S10 [Encephalitozoon hellem ATCC 50504]|uniref:Ribosomal protein S10 n=1 Tax=Encephalitozoon hellem TaxID=27973 RepID=A0A9Q9CCI3_ENCHE|nr:ribosomal protein S10 [Encephalitozoon hellem ATCC 50504]AFM99334.1 ribosomal protein S10 [Encephalitozoon hellem ATCC 50504]UTX44338.1 ribosomal protein S10 [Encephalitozoon hellem]WEL39839.1 ribosomal protein S10p/S20e [Encephalitozoon hellem]|eukprot:XP_003888315.1 ribosomal protein S10 [Encephalitozoon hellem ATCC 50504]